MTSERVSSGESADSPCSPNQRLPPGEVDDYTGVPTIIVGRGFERPESD